LLIDEMPISVPVNNRGWPLKQLKKSFMQCACEIVNGKESI